MVDSWVFWRRRLPRHRLPLAVFAPQASSTPTTTCCFCAAAYLGTPASSGTRHELPRDRQLLLLLRRRLLRTYHHSLLLRRKLLEWAALSTNVRMDGGGLGGRSTILLRDRPEMFVSKRGAPIASHHTRLNLTLYTHADYRSLVPQAPSVRGCQRARGGQSHTAATAGLRPPEQARGRLAVHACRLRLEPI